MSLAQFLLQRFNQAIIRPYLPQSENHLVNEFLKFVPRMALDESITKSLCHRSDQRAKFRDTYDKMSNPLTALSGTPGSGKSTALLHYPASPSFQSYVASRQNSNISTARVSAGEPIISLVTFNSAMEGGPCAFGLRIVYAALRSMQLLLPGDPLSVWRVFRERFSSDVHLSAVMAVRLLYSAFGHDRLIFIGVDELVKSGADGEVIKEIGELLSSNSRVDIVVTALSPVYVEALLSGSQRPIDYVVPPALFEPIEEYTTLVNDYIEKMKSENKSMDTFVERIVRAMPLFTAGHPRTLQHLVECAKSGDLWRDLQMCSLEPKEFIYEVANLDVFQNLSTAPETEAERTLLLSMQPSHADANDTTGLLFRKMLESKKCFVHRTVGDCRFLPTTNLSSFFSMLAKLDSIPTTDLGPLSAAAKVLFHRALAVSGMWERACALSIVARVYQLDKRRIVANVKSVLGLDSFHERCLFVNKLELVMAPKNGTVLHIPSSLVVAKDHQSGWDLLLCSEAVGGEPRYTYIEVQVGVWKKFSASQMVAHKIGLILEDHFTVRAKDSNEPLEMHSVSIVFSIYAIGIELAKHDFNKEAVLLGLKEIRKEDQKKVHDRAELYIETFFDSHVHFMGKKELDEVTIPILLPLVRLVQKFDC